ncbi:MAG: MFS transporter, partial [Pseudomonas sp.]
YALSYLAFCLPALLAGNLARIFGLVATTDGYGAVLMVLALSAMAGLLRSRSARVCEVNR